MVRCEALRTFRPVHELRHRCGVSRADGSAPDGGTGRWFLPLVIGLLVVDLVLIALHATYHEGLPGLSGDIRIRLDKDRGFAEIVGCTQLLVAAGLLLRIAARRRAPVAAVWAVGLVVLAIDDLVALHERAGTALRTLLGGSLDAHAQQIGELLFFVVVGSLLGTAVLLTHRRSDSGTRDLSWRLVAAVAFVAVTGVGVDALHGLVGAGTVAGGLLTVVEDGGELLGMTLVLIVTLHAVARRPRPADDRHGRRVGGLDPVDRAGAAAHTA